MRPDRFALTRERVVDGIRARHPLADLAGLRVLTDVEVRTVAGLTGWATRAGPINSFDWSLVNAALGRDVTAFEQRIISQSVMTTTTDADDVSDLVAAIDEVLAT